MGVMSRTVARSLVVAILACGAAVGPPALAADAVAVLSASSREVAD